MATQIEQILGKDINSLKELREEIKRLQDSIAAIDPATQEFKDTTVKLTAAQEQLTAVTRAGKDGNDAAKDSIVGMEREYKSLYNTYKMLTEEQRNSNFGKEMAASLNTLSTKLNETKKGVGNFKDNIGRYSESVIDAFTKMGGSVGGLVGPFATATKGVMGFNAALKANPVGAVITLIMTLINAVKALKDSIKGNEESQMRWNQAMASFQPIIDAAKNAMDKFGQAIVSVVEFIAKVVDKIRVAKAAFTDFLGITKGAKEQVKEQQKTYKELAKSVNDLTKAKREAQKQNAADEAEVQRLREEASETTNLVEKKELLQQAKDKQAEIDQRNIEIAKEELRILEEQSKLTSNSAADNEKLAAAVAKVAEAEATAANNARAFNKQLGNGTTTTNNFAGSLNKTKEEAQKLYQELVDENKTEIQRLTEKYEKEKKLLEKYHLDTTLLTQKYKKDLDKIEQEANEKARQKFTELRKWLTISTEEVQKAKGLTEAEILKDTISNQSSQIDSYLNSFKLIWENTDMFDDLVSSFKQQLNYMIDDGFDGLSIPPEWFTEESEANMQQLYDYVTSYLINLKNGIKTQTEEIENIFADKRIAEKMNEDLKKVIDDELEILAKGVGSDEYKAIREGNIRASLEVEKAALEEELADFKGTKEHELELWNEYYSVVGQMREKDFAAQELMAQRSEEITTNAFNAYNTMAQSINTVLNSVSSLIQAQVNDGKITKAEAEKKIRVLKKLEAVSLAVNIAQIAASTAAGIMDVWKSYGAELALNAQTAAATGPAAAATKAALDAKSLTSAIIRTTALGTAGLANIAAATIGSVQKQQALNSQLEGLNDNGGAAGTAATPMEIDSTPYTYTRTLQTVDEEDELNRPIYVSVTDINNAQNRVRVRDNESSF